MHVVASCDKDKDVSVDTLKLLIESEPKLLMQKDKENEDTVLHMATKRDKIEIIEAIINIVKNLNRIPLTSILEIQNKRKNTALLVAVKFRKLDIFR